MICDSLNGCPSTTHNLHCGYPNCAKGQRDLSSKNTRKIADAPEFCRDPDHNPPTHMDYEPGVWEHVCPSCNQRVVFTILGMTL